MISIFCTHCGQQLRIDDRYAGQVGRCNRCQGEIVVPIAPGTAPTPPPPPQNLIDGADDLTSLNIDLDTRAAEPASPVRTWNDGFGTWFPVVGVVFAVLTVLSAGLLGVFFIPLSLILVAVDLAKQGLSTKRAFNWLGGMALLWIVVFPLYLHKRRRFEEDDDATSVLKTVPAACGAILFLLVISGTLISMVSVDSRGLDRAENRYIQKLNERNPRARRAYTPSARQSPVPAKVSMAKFKRIQVGMSYAEVVRILGSSGTMLSENRIDGVPGVMESIHTTMYSWEGDGFGANMNVIFQNDAVFQKAQFGLQ